MNYTKLNICFVAQNAYGALTGVDTGHIGGIEHKQSFIAKWLARRGHQVSLITWDEGHDGDDIIQGVRVIRMCARDAGVKGIRFFYPKWTDLCKAMRKANADIYYYNCGDLELGQVVMWCRRHGRKCVYSVASEPDCDRRLPEMHTLRERVLYRYGLKHVDSVIVQTRHQQQKLREGFGIDSTVIKMPCNLGDNEFICSELSHKESTHVLWVGRISEEKRFEWFLDVAEQCPEIQFDVAGTPNTYATYAQALIKRAAKLSNVKMHGRIPHAEMKKVYCCCKVLCCTSEYEGFPNTFVEAWSLGIPVVSTFDPDCVIATNGLGSVAQDVVGIVACLREVVRSSESWHRISSAAKQYYLAHHTPEKCLPILERLILDVVGYSS